MLKASFYPKLALGNLRRNKSTYLPYLLACVVSIIALYTLVAINSNGALDTLPHAASVKIFTVFGTVIVTFFCGILLFYTNSFLIKRRKRELGLYSMLGMTKGNIGLVLFFESLFIDLFSLVLGLCGGMLLGKLLFSVLMWLVRFPVDIAMPISGQAIGVTLAIFGIVFALTLLTNLLGVRKANPIDLMAGARQGEREPRASWVLTVIGVLTLGAGYYIAITVKTPMDALMLFFVAAFLVIIGTFCLFTSGSILILKLLRKKKSYYYTPKHFVSVSGMIYRMKQNAAGLAAICILSCMVLFTVSFTASMQIGGEEGLRERYPYEYDYQAGSDENAERFLAGAQQAATETGVELTPMRDMRVFITSAADGSDNFVSTSDYQTNSNYIFFRLIPLEDYNAAEGTNLSLAPGQALIYTTGGSYNSDNLTLDGITYGLTRLDSMERLRAGMGDVAEMHTLILPDMDAVTAAMDARPADVQADTDFYLAHQVSFDVAGSEEAKAAFAEAFALRLDEMAADGTMGGWFIRDEMRQSWYTNTGGFLFLGLYLGVIFLLAAAMIIYYKQLSEGHDDRDRYEIMQKVGMSEGEVRRTINGQIRAVFFLPLIVAVVHSIVAFWPGSRLLTVFGVTSNLMLFIAFAGTVLIYAVVYLLVYRGTARTYFRLVKRAEATQ